MTQEDVVQIRVEGYTVGIMGLKGALEEMCISHAEKPDPEVADELLNRLSKKNYIPEKAKAPYRKAFLNGREVYRHTGFMSEADIVSRLKQMGVS